MTRDEAVSELKAAGAEDVRFAEFDHDQLVGLGVTVGGKRFAEAWNKDSDRTAEAVARLKEWLKANASVH
jgi:hypothetical protein